MKYRTHVVAALLTAAFVSESEAQSTRQLSTDRPDRTESPYTVPRGWMQIESDLVSWGRLDGDDERVTSTQVATLNMKLGVTDRLDLQVLFNPWVLTDSEMEGVPAVEDDGTGQAGLRVKINLFGNDEDTALALLPFATVPTEEDDVFDLVTWGLVIPYSMPIGDNAALSAMLGATRVNNEHWWVTTSASLSSSLAGDLGGFAELYLSRDTFESDAIDDATFDVGLTYAPGDWQLDAGVYRGLDSVTEDWRFFLGASGRFSVFAR